MKIKNFKILAILMALFCFAPYVSAGYVYSTMKLGNGQVIKKCRFSNGKIDYCTQDDLLRAIDAIHNPQKYMNAQQKALLKKNQQRDAQESAARKAEEQNRVNLEKATIPNSLKLLEERSNSDAKRSKLHARYEAGIYDSKEWILWEYRENRLYDLKPLNREFENAYNGYKKNVITKLEFDQILSDLHQGDSEMGQKLNEIMKVTYEDLEKEKNKAEMEKRNAELAERKKREQQQLNQQRSMYIPTSTNDWVQQGINILKLIK